MQPFETSRRGQPSGSSPTAEPSVPDLMSNILGHASKLMRTELRLARGEVTSKVKEAGIGLGLLAGSVVLGLASVVMLLVTIMAVLAALGVPVWLAAFLALLLGLGGTAGLAWAGFQRLKADEMLPERTLRQLQRDRQMVKEEVQ
ncbi:phage holin family protein (plasmid) [Paracoccus liaowanqingii]|uniref:Phage holin family protein n=2 Tax=Paracoccus liaowanqingii TaxID=2560053 RepID=A0A4Y5STN7_9RHOB|nr:phage holin family protein [Paracoccus liaowanqingii]